MTGTDLFWADPSGAGDRSHGDLVAALDRTRSVPRRLHGDAPGDLLVDLLAAVVAGVDAVAVGPSEPGGEDRSRPVDLEVSGWGDVRAAVRRNASTVLRLRTSGTTGGATRVEVPVSTLLRGVKVGPRFRGDVWGFGYDPTHFGGLQVFFQAVLNRASLVPLHDADPATVAAAVDEYGITHLSATPTFYRHRVRRLEGPFREVRRVTSGGEPFDEELVCTLREVFPGAEVRNVYALTEAGTILESDGAAFAVPGDRRDRVRIVDGELHLHESLLADPERPDVEGGWYATGDAVEFVDGESFRIVGRTDDVVSVAGYRVVLPGVEAVLATHPDVLEARVWPRETSLTGRVLVADVEPAAGAARERIRTELRDHVRAELPPWERPRKFNVVGAVPTTRTGKKRRDR